MEAERKAREAAEAEARAAEEREQREYEERRAKRLQEKRLREEAEKAKKAAEKRARETERLEREKAERQARKKRETAEQKKDKPIVQKKKTQPVKVNFGEMNQNLEKSNLNFSFKTGQRFSRHSKWTRSFNFDHEKILCKRSRPNVGSWPEPWTRFRRNNYERIKSL